MRLSHFGHPDGPKLSEAFLSSSLARALVKRHGEDQSAPHGLFPKIRPSGAKVWTERRPFCIADSAPLTRPPVAGIRQTRIGAEIGPYPGLPPIAQ